MKTLALRFGETFSPECGTIAAHQQVIVEKNMYAGAKQVLLLAIRKLMKH